MIPNNVTSTRESPGEELPFSDYQDSFAAIKIATLSYMEIAIVGEWFS